MGVGCCESHEDLRPKHLALRGKRETERDC